MNFQDFISTPENKSGIQSYVQKNIPFSIQSLVWCEEGR